MVCVRAYVLKCRPRAGRCGDGVCCLSLARVATGRQWLSRPAVIGDGMKRAFFFFFVQAASHSVVCAPAGLTRPIGLNWVAFYVRARGSSQASAILPTKVVPESLIVVLCFNTFFAVGPVSTPREGAILARSPLYPLLPGALVRLMVTKGARAFAEALLADG